MKLHIFFGISDYMTANFKDFSKEGEETLFLECITLDSLQTI